MEARARRAWTAATSRWSSATPREPPTPQGFTLTGRSVKTSRFASLSASNAIIPPSSSNADASTPTSGAFYTLVPTRPRRRGERRSLRTLPGASLRPPVAFNPRALCLSTPTDAFELHPDVRLYRTALITARRRATTAGTRTSGARTPDASWRGCGSRGTTASRARASRRLMRRRRWRCRCRHRRAAGGSDRRRIRPRRRRARARARSASGFRGRRRSTTRRRPRNATAPTRVASPSKRREKDHRCRPLVLSASRASPRRRRRPRS